MDLSAQKTPDKKSVEFSMLSSIEDQVGLDSIKAKIESLCSMPAELE